MAKRILRFLALLLFGGAGLAIFKRTSAKRGRTDSRPKAAATPVAISASSEATASPKATSASPKPKRRSNGWSPKLPVRRVLWITGILLLAGAVTFALFTQTTANSGNTYASAADYRAPTVDRSVIQPNGGNNASAGYVKQGQSYFVYANVTDTGNPASGISTVTGNVCNVTSTSCSSVAMTAGSYTVNSVTYNYRSAAQTASNPLSEGSKSYSITATDVASNSGTNSSFSVTVDNTGPTVSTIACGGTGCTSDYVGAGKTYYVYSQVADSGTGVNTVTTDPRNITASASATTAMSSSGGPWTIGGTSYNYRSIQLTADSGLADASTKTYTVTGTDNVTNATMPTGTATVDNTAPTMSSLIIDKTLPGRLTGAIGASDGYFIYADLSDAASGVATGTSTTDVSTLTTGKTSVSMCYSASGYAVNTFGGTGTTTYHYKSDNDGSPCDGTFTSLTTDSGLLNGASKTWTIAFKDNAGNSTTGNNSVTIDNVSGTVTNFEINNTSGGTIGRLEQNDIVNFGMSESVDPEGVLGGWFGDNSTTGNVVVRLTDGGGTCVASSDQLQVYNAANSAPTNLGTVCLGGTGYNTSGSTITFGATGTPSNMAMGCLTACTNVTLGTQSAAAATQAGNTTSVWTPTGSFYDGAGNNYQATPVSKTIDNTAPTISATRICGGQSCSADFVGQGKTYFIYANATDANAGIDPNTGVKADVSNITTGATSVALTTCSSNCTVNGTTYTYKSAQQTANGTLSGTKAWTLTVQDNDSNKATTTPTATVDNTAPSVASSAIAKSTGTGLYLSGKIKQGGTYYIYANVTDTAGSGVDRVTANVNNITTGQTAVTLNSGSFSVNGTSYNYRSAAVTANATLTNGASLSYTVTGTDNAVNSSGPSFNVTVDNTVPTANTTTKVAATNKTGGTASKPEVGDTIVYTYSEQIDPESILAGWTGASTNVTVRMNNNTACPGSANTNDNVTIFNTANTTQANIGCIDLLNTTFVTANVTFGQTGSTTLSTMVQSGNAITVTLGSTTGTTATVAGTRNMIWWPSASAFDAAGNAETTTSQAETDNDTDF
ncbi:MAG: hypothetical protein AABM43_10330 [Actinomycetota bacterium]